MNKNKIVSTLMATRKDSGKVELDPTKNAEGSEDLTHAQNLIEAISAGDAQGVLNAIKALTTKTEE